MSRAAVQALFAEIGGLRDFDLVREFHDHPTWIVVVDGLEVMAEWDEARDVLVLTGDAGQPDASARGRIDAALLQYNYAWRETGGVRMALDGPDGAVVQMLDLSAAALDAPRLADTVSAFAALLGSWRELIAAGPVPVAASPNDPMLAPGAIRA